MSGMRIKSTFVTAAVIGILAAAWIASGQLNGGGETAATTSIAERESEEAATPAAQAPVTVRVRTVTAEPRSANLVLRGRTEAERKVELRSETVGTIAAVPVAEGANVKEGETVCEIAVDSRQAMLDQAKAQMRQAQLEYEASRQLAEKGHRSATQAAGALAAFEAAQAEVKRMQVELDHTRITAPFDGLVDTRMVEVGDYLSAGAPCALIVDEQPFLVIGQVAERDVELVQPGSKGSARLITGQVVEGTVRYVGKVADAATRTFRVELEVPNEDRSMRDGMTAELSIAVQTVAAHRIASSILALNDQGTIGVRIVEDSKVHFVPVTIIADDVDGVWVTGLPARAVIITVGQDYVREGQRVTPVPEEQTVSEALPAPVSVQ